MSKASARSRIPNGATPSRRLPTCPPCSKCLRSSSRRRRPGNSSSPSAMDRRRARARPVRMACRCRRAARAVNEALAEMSGPRRQSGEWAAAAGIATAIVVCSRAAAAQGVPPFKAGLSYVVAYGPKQYPVLTLLLALSALMLAIIAIILILVLLGAFSRRASSNDPAAVPVDRPNRGLSFIYVGIALTVPALLAISAWTYDVLAQVASPRGAAAFTVRVIGHQ